MNMRFYRRQTGLSLVEVLIATTLSLILMTAVVQIFLGSKTAYLTTENSARAHENGRFALDILGRYVRIAGYWDYASIIEENVPEPFVPLCGDADAACSQDGTGNNNSDRIAIQFDSPGDVDCNGNTPSADRVMTNVFWIQDDGFGVSALYCRGFDMATNAWLGTAQPYISGIDSMQVLYGIADDDDVVTSYVNASRVNTDWDRVRAIKVALLVQSGQETDANFAQKTYVLLDGAPLTFNDGQSRYVFSTTLYVNNNEV